jgi:RNA polymerase sigma factor for flagellar operon FliA
VEKHLALVNQIVARFMRRLPANVDRGDLLAAGMYGLMTSLERNGGDEGPAFEGYAKLRIRGAILDELRAQDWLSRRARWAASGRSEEYTGPTALVGFEDVSEGERTAPLADDDAPDALALLEAMGRRSELEAAVERLPERERMIIAMHYFEGVRLKDIGKLLCVSEPRVSQLHARAISRLREQLAEA